MKHDFLDITPAEKQKILEDLFSANHLRKTNGMPLYEIKTEYTRVVTKKRIHLYEQNLRPYLDTFYNTMPQTRGVARYAGMSDARQAAMDQLYHDHGIRPPPKNFSITYNKNKK